MLQIKLMLTLVQQQFFNHGQRGSRQLTCHNKTTQNKFTWWYHDMVDARLRHQNIGTTTPIDRPHCPVIENSVSHWDSTFMQDRMQSHVWWQEVQGLVQQQGYFNRLKGTCHRTLDIAYPTREDGDHPNVCPHSPDVQLLGGPCGDADVATTQPQRRSCPPPRNCHVHTFRHHMSQRC